MNQRFSKWVLGVMSGLLLFGSLACGIGQFPIPKANLGDLQTELQSVDLLGARQAQVTVDMRFGELYMESGLFGLMDAEFIYNLPDLKPAVDYKVSGDVGQLMLNIPGSQMPPQEARYNWNLKLRRDIPTDLTVVLGTGQAILKLNDSNVVNVNLSDPYSGYEENGFVLADFTGNQTLEMLNVNLQGRDRNTEISLQGQWNHDVQVYLQGGRGDTTVHLPSQIGVRVDSAEGFRGVHIAGLTKLDENTLVNAAYGKSPVTLTINLVLGSGIITLDQRD